MSGKGSGKGEIKRKIEKKRNMSKDEVRKVRAEQGNENKVKGRGEMSVKEGGKEGEAQEKENQEKKGERSKG